MRSGNGVRIVLTVYGIAPIVVGRIPADVLVSLAVSDKVVSFRGVGGVMVITGVRVVQTIHGR